MSEYRHRISRRGFITGAATAAASASLLANLPPGVVEAAQGRKGSLDRIEHVIILMQENRSFDHYLGTMRGVRGFGDRAALQLNTGQDVFHQPDPLRPDGGFLLPWRVDTSKVDGQDLDDTPHDWNSTHAAWDGGRWDRWPPTKSELSMTYFGQSDIPFQRALAHAFTVCDNYFCSVHGPTTPNRCYLWTGTIDPHGLNGGPCAANPDDYLPVFTWKTYPERLQAAGISWQLYANDEVGDGSGEDGFVGDFGDNPLWLFQAYHDALASSDPKVHQLAERASLRNQWKPNSGLGHSTQHVLAQFIADCQAGTLPAVSWVVAPYAYSEHPQARPVDGAAYTQTMLNALWSNHDLWSTSVVFIDYDENDGFFDHLVPPAAPTDTPDEFLPAIQPGFRGPPPPPSPMVPIGLGPRVPMTVVSPWSHGGWVNSQVFDHTSVLRFLEAWTGVQESNISAWRRAICGDLTSCFDFTAPRTVVPMLPDTTALRQQADQTESSLPKPAPPPPGQQVVPEQDGGSEKARALPYQPMANISVTRGSIIADLSNQGSATLQLAVYAFHALNEDALRFDVSASGSAHASVAPDPVTGAFDVEIHGPNGFLRRAAGTVLDADVEAALALTGGPRLELTLRNPGAQTQTVHVSGLHHTPRTFVLGARQSQVVALDPLGKNHGWYDLTVSVEGHAAFVRRFAGHLENGSPSRTGPD
jgi:phospholipase C